MTITVASVPSGPSMSSNIPSSSDPGGLDRNHTPQLVVEVEVGPPQLTVKRQRSSATTKLGRKLEEYSKVLEDLGRKLLEKLAQKKASGASTSRDRNTSRSLRI